MAKIAVHFTIEWNLELSLLYRIFFDSPGHVRRHTSYALDYVSAHRPDPTVWAIVQLKLTLHESLRLLLFFASALLSIVLDVLQEFEKLLLWGGPLPR